MTILSSDSRDYKPSKREQVPSWWCGFITKRFKRAIWNVPLDYSLFFADSVPSMASTSLLRFVAWHKYTSYASRLLSGPSVIWLQRSGGLELHKRFGLRKDSQIRSVWHGICTPTLNISTDPTLIPTKDIWYPINLALSDFPHIDVWEKRWWDFFASFKAAKLAC